MMSLVHQLCTENALNFVYFVDLIIFFFVSFEMFVVLFRDSSFLILFLFDAVSLYILSRLCLVII